MTAQTKQILIIGGGITGLSAAYYAQQMMNDAGVPAQIKLVEKSDSLGGKIQTLRRDGFIIERGPDSFLARKTPIIDLTFALGLENELVATNPAARKTYILKDGHFHPMPPGLVLGIPTKWTSFLKSGLISPLGKARAALDLLLPKRKLDADEDEALGGLLERRLGKQVLARIVEPLLAGIYAGDTKALSLQATFPQFQQMEQQHGSLILGMMRSQRQSAPNTRLPAHIRGSVFLTYRNGLSTLVDALAAHLRGADMAIRTGVGVKSVKPLETSAEKKEIGYRVQLTDGNEMNADVIISAIPAYQTAELFRDVNQIDKLSEIPYVSVANLILAFDEKDMPQFLDGSGFLVPRTEGYFLTACTWTSVKWLHTAPPGKVLLRCYIGRSGEEQWTNWSDEQFVMNVRHDLKRLMKITAEPLFYEITRWEKSMPQYPVYHLQHLRSVREQLAVQRPGVFIAGAGYHGVGLPDCIRQGKEAAEAAVKTLLTF